MENKLELLQRYQKLSQLISLVQNKLIEIDDENDLRKGHVLKQVMKISDSFFLPSYVKKKKIDVLVAKDTTYVETQKEFLRGRTELMIRCLTEAEEMGLAFLDNEVKLTIRK